MTPYYTEPGIEIYHGDCRDFMPGLGKVDLVITDPPYGKKETHAGHLSTVNKHPNERLRQEVLML